MNGSLRSENIPGTVFNIVKMDGATGGEFLNKVFYITNGIMLPQIREITGLDGTTLQNWVKRGWVSNPHKKSYDKEQVARILIICMMRDTMQLSRIAFLLQYINGELGLNVDFGEWTLLMTPLMLAVLIISWILLRTKSGMLSFIFIDSFITFVRLG
jgi:di/tricarboxylate transporter